jgi:hypothetical protein
LFATMRAGKPGTNGAGLATMLALIGFCGSHVARMLPGACNSGLATAGLQRRACNIRLQASDFGG